MNRRSYELMGLGAGAACLAAFAFAYRLRFPFDDTFISFRYAEHFAQGYGFVWNIGGPPTEGYTNFLYVVVLAALRLITPDLLLASQVLGLLTTIATGSCVYFMAERLGAARAPIVAAALFFTIPLIWINAVSGMETSFFVLIVALTLTAFVRSWSPWCLYGFALAATLTRPEAGLLAIILFVASPWKRRDLFPFIVAFVLPLVGYAIWKYSYFGDILPNSFYVKVLNGGSHVLPGAQYVRLFLASATVLVVGAVGALWSARRDRRIAALEAWWLALVVFYLFVLPLEGLYDRFLLPVLPSLAVLCAYWVTCISARGSRWVPIGAALCCLLVSFAWFYLSPRTQQSLAAHEEVWDRSMDQVVAVLDQLPNARSILVGYADAGYVVYRTKVRHLDLFGLNTTSIARARTLDAKRRAVLRADPDLLLLPIRSLDDSCPRLVEDAYGAGRASRFTPSAAIDAFPYPLLFLSNDSTATGRAVDAALRGRSQAGGVLRSVPNCVE